MLQLAWRNLGRHLRRSLITAGAVALVVYLSLLYFGMGGASKNSMYQRLTEEGGHVQVHVSDWREQRSFTGGLIRDAAEVRERVARVAGERLGASETVGVLEVPALISGETRSRALPVTGRDWPESVLDRRIEGDLVEGRFLEGDDEAIVLGQSLADALDVAVGDEVYVYAPEGEGWGAAAYRLVGLLDLADPNLEIRTAHVTLTAAQELAAPGAMGRFEIHATELNRVGEDDAALAAAAELREALPELQVESWRQLEPSVVQLLDAMDPMLYGVSVLFFVLAGLLVLNTVYLSVMERIREFGLIISLGAGGGRVTAMVAMESVILCLTGALVGGAAGLGHVAALADGFTVPSLAEYWASFGLDPVLYLSLTPGQIAFALGFAIVTALLAALWPARVAANLEPVEAMRFQA